MGSTPKLGAGTNVPVSYTHLDVYKRQSLQREANRFFGYTAQKTLDMLQELYEEKMVTYPRTDLSLIHI